MTLIFVENNGQIGLQEDDITGEYFIAQLDEFGEAIVDAGILISQHRRPQTTHRTPQTTRYSSRTQRQETSLSGP